MDRITAVLFFAVLWICSVAVISGFVLWQFGWVAAVAAAVPLTVVVTVIAVALGRASRITC